MDIAQIIKEHAPALLERLTKNAGFGGGEAQGFLDGLLKKIGGMLTGGDLDVGALLGGDGPQALLSKLNVSELAKETNVDPAKAEKGLNEIAGPLVKSFNQSVDDPSDLLKAFGGGDAGGMIGKLAGGFFKK